MPSPYNDQSSLGDYIGESTPINITGPFPGLGYVTSSTSITTIPNGTIGQHLVIGPLGTPIWDTQLSSFDVSAPSGPTQTISPGDTLSFTNSNLIKVETANTNVVNVGINTTGANLNDVPYFDGTNVVWGNASIGLIYYSENATTGFVIANATGTRSVAVGDFARVSGNSSAVFGNNFNVTGNGSIGLGYSSTLVGNGSLSFTGLSSTTNGDSSVNVGIANFVNGDASVNFGIGNSVPADNSGAMGKQLSVSGANSFVYGYNFPETIPNVTTIANSTSAFVRIRNDINLQGTVQINGTLATPIRIVNTPTTIGSTDFTVLVNTSAGAVSVTLPQSAFILNGSIFNIKRIGGTTNAVDILAGPGDTIDGAPSIQISTLLNAYAGFTVTKIGNTWYTI